MRSTLNKEKLSNLVILCIDNNSLKTLDLDDVINKFVKEKNSKIYFKFVNNTSFNKQNYSFQETIQITLSNI